jgi:DNA-binding CsgD family transcriptional regulator
MLADGVERRVMAINLGVSYHIAKHQVEIMYHKLGADNGPQAVSIGYQLGILKVGEWPHD